MGCSELPLFGMQMAYGQSLLNGSERSIEQNCRLLPSSPRRCLSNDHPCRIGPASPVLEPTVLPICAALSRFCCAVTRKQGLARYGIIRSGHFSLGRTRRFASSGSTDPATSPSRLGKRGSGSLTRSISLFYRWSGLRVGSPMVAPLISCPKPRRPCLRCARRSFLRPRMTRAPPLREGAKGRKGKTIASRWRRTPPASPEGRRGRR